MNSAHDKAVVAPTVMAHYFVFEAGGRALALPLSCVERVVRAVEVTPLPQRNGRVRGVIHVHGALVPVLDLRVPEDGADMELWPVRLSDHLVLAQAANGLLAFLVEAVRDVVEISLEDSTTTRGVLRVRDETVMIFEESNWLSSVEKAYLARVVPEWSASQGIISNGSLL